MKPRPIIAVTRRVPPVFLQELTDSYDLRLHDDFDPLGDRLPSLLAGAVAAILAPYDRVDEALLRVCPDLKVVANASAGFDNLDIQACTKRRVYCCNAPDGVTQSTADFAMGLLVASARRIHEGDALVRRRGWMSSTYESFMSPAISGSVLGILGMGRIGQAIARRASLGFGMKVIYVSRTGPNTEAEDAFGCRRVSTEDLFREADHVICALPLSDETRNLIGAREFALMKGSATFVNVGRGGVVDEQALAQALSTGQIGAAALDVFASEPNVCEQLLHAPRTLMTPHVASATLDARLSTLRQAASNIEAALNGLTPPNALNLLSNPISQAPLRLKAEHLHD